MNYIKRGHTYSRWHLGNCNEAYLPTSRGFDSQYGFYSSFINNFDHIINANPNLYDFQQNDQPLKNPQMAADYAGVQKHRQTHKNIVAYNF